MVEEGSYSSRGVHGGEGSSMMRMMTAGGVNSLKRQRNSGGSGIVLGFDGAPIA
jgi:hypothetical protein